MDTAGREDNVRKTMLIKLIEKAAQGRLSWPLVLALSVLAIGVNEWTYQRARATLDRGIALTDARIQGAATLQALSDAENAALRYAQGTNAAHAERYRQAIATLHQVEQGAFDLVASVDPERTVSVDKVRALSRQRVATLDDWVRRTAAGQREVALQDAAGDNGSAGRQALRDEFDEVLKRAAAVQQSARVSLYDGLVFNRAAIFLLVFLGLLAMAVMRRLLRQAEALKAQEQQRLEVLVHQRTAELRELAGHLVTAREDERAHVARELHDEMGGLLTAMKLEFARMRRLGALPEAATERLQAIETRLNEGIALKRRIIENLRPSSLDQLGLVEALRMLCADVASAFDKPVSTAIDDVAVPKDAELTIYRFAQEALTNIGKYAQCSRIEVRLHQDGERVRVSVSDDGRGFDAARVTLGGHGLRGMRLRLESHGGTLRIDSAPGRGTTVIGELPAAAPG
jgi:signal transduction histidine kinase